MRRKGGPPAVSSRRRPTGYVVCLRNDDYAASLEPRKLYPVLPDVAAEEHGLIRVIDESGEDYLYPADLFVAVRLPQSVTRATRRHPSRTQIKDLHCFPS